MKVVSMNVIVNWMLVWPHSNVYNSWND